MTEIFYTTTAAFSLFIIKDLLITSFVIIIYFFVSKSLVLVANNLKTTIFHISSCPVRHCLSLLFSTTCKERSMPAATPAAVMNLPLSTKRTSLSGMAEGSKARISYGDLWIIHPLFGKNPFQVSRRIIDGF